MKLLSVNLARSIWLGPTADLNPSGFNLASVLIPFLIETYKFKNYPTITDNTDISNGYNFQFGDFYIEGDLPIEVGLSIYNDGMTADASSSTIHSDAFLEDVLTRIAEIFKLAFYEPIFRRKLYLSQLYVHTENQIGLLNPKLNQISEYLSSNIEQDDCFFEAGGITFWPDQTKKMVPTPFTFERALGVPFSENRYYSSAPLQTDQHFELLEKLEMLLV